LFELKTICPLVTLSDRVESVVAHPDCDHCPGEASFMASRQLRITGRVVLDGGEWRVYVRVTVIVAHIGDWRLVLRLRLAH
jgi:hypothetical protein